MRTLKDSTLFRERMFVAGTWRNAKAGATMPVQDPSTRDTIGTVPDADADDARAAVDAAEKAFADWRKTTPASRGALLDEWHALIHRHLDDLALILTTEQGKPLEEASNEIRYGASFVKWYAEEARRVYGSTVPAAATDRRILVLKEPIGVCGIITPWNFPTAMITRKVAPALAAGCTVVIKPSDFTPYSALALAVLAERAGIPPGVVNVVTGRPEGIGGELTGNAAVRKISFTGSTRVGALLMRQSADSIKRLSLELGGNAPFIVFDDADLDLAVEGAMASKFRNGGQTCVCANRILVQDGVYEQFSKRLADRVRTLKVGPGTAPGVDIGPMINQAAVEKIDRHVSDALDRGAILLARSSEVPDGTQYVAPVVIGSATTGMLVANEETFGPVAALFRFRTETDAIALANATPFGLAAYFYTQNLARSWRVAESLEYGMVGLNTGIISAEAAPFGGVKQSGLGREGGRIGIEEYLESKSLHIGGLDTQENVSDQH